MHVTWWMPGMPAVLAATLYSFELAVRSRCSLILVTTRIHVTLRLRFGAGPDLGRHRLLDLLLEMGDEADRTSDHRQAAGDPPWELHLARDGRDRPGRVDRGGAFGVARRHVEVGRLIGEAASRGGGRDLRGSASGASAGMGRGVERRGRMRRGVGVMV